MRIARFYKRLIYKGKAGKREYYCSIYWTGGRNKKVELTGTFTNPPWSASYKLSYNEFFKAFHGIIKLKEGDQFKFVIDGSYEVSFDYPVIYVFNLDNKFRIHKAFRIIFLCLIIQINTFLNSP